MYQQIALNKRKTVVLMGIFIIFIGIIGWLLSQTTTLGEGAIFMAVILSLFMALFSYFSGDKVALFSARARPIAREENPYLYRLVENLCITAGIPIPKIHIIDDPALNAFATGRSPKHASIAFTTGILQRLENEELEGVIAHELSHVKNYDIRVMTVVIILVGTIALLADWFLRASIFSGRRDERGGGQIGIILFVLGIVLALLSPLIAQLIQLAVSRKREFLADADGALLTRYPEGLARALEKIQNSHTPLQRANTATAHLFIANPFGQRRQRFMRLFSTHPPVEERIHILRTMA